MASADAEKLYKAHVTYFERPITSNYGYKYKVNYVVNPYDFMVQIDDDMNAQYESILSKLLEQHFETLKQAVLEKDAVEIQRIDDMLFYVGMPVLVEHRVSNESDMALYRSEVLGIGENNLDILLVDFGGVLTKSKEDVLSITPDILRVPRLLVSCKLAQICPENATSWPLDRDYKADFTGQTSQVVTFLDYYPDSKAYEAILEVDNVNVSLSFFHSAVAQPYPLGYFTPSATRRFPVPDYSAWIGLKVIVFGVKCFKDEKDYGKIKCVLQMQPEHVNTIQDKIVAYIENTPAEIKGQKFDKKVGDTCLANFGGEYFRATILKIEGDKYHVEYVDYRDKLVVSASDMIKLPAELQKMAEGSVICQITDFLTSEFNDIELLKEMIENKDLYAVVDACDPSIFGPELLVSLFEPTESFNGHDKSFGEILGITEKPTLVREILQTMELIPEEWESILLLRENLKPGKIHRATVMSPLNNPDSVWIHMDEHFDAAVRLSTELTQFYENGGCDADIKASFMEADATGKYVAAKPPRDDDAQEKVWQRARVIEENWRDGKVFLLFVDDGSADWVKKEDVFPLHKYFAKDPLLALELKMK